MNELLDKTATYLTGENVVNTNLEALESLSQQHPYFSVAHLVLAKKYKLENHPGFLNQAQKTALHFNNQHLLHYQLADLFPEISITENDDVDRVEGESESLNATEKKPVFEIVEETENPSDLFSVAEISAASTLAKETLAVEEEFVAAEIQDENEITLDELHPEKEEILEDIVQENIDAKSTQLEGEPVINQDTEEKTESIDRNVETANAAHSEDASPGEEEKFNYEQLDAVHLQQEATVDDNHFDIKSDEQEGMLIEEISNSGTVAQEKIITDDFVESKVEPHNETFTNDLNKTDSPALIEEPFLEKDLLDSAVESNLVQPANIETLITDSITAGVSSQAETNQPQVNASSSTEPLIPIEPYYTIDYFASQGIKLVLEKSPQDKLGKQLRSFTDWLKHMKKLGPEDALKAGNDAAVDYTIKNIADTSNTPEEILTEAMADVLIKQGKTNQAAELYNKLSFLYPDKSAYFADQIQKLKGI